MTRSVSLPALALLCATLGSAQAAMPSVPSATSTPTLARTTEALRVAHKVDVFIDQGLSKAKATANPIAEDSAFLRRVTLDLLGRIPNVNDSRRFVSDRSAEKREQAIERLLESPAYVNHMTGIWLQLLVPEANADFQKRYLAQGMQRWLRKHFADNTGYDKMVHELVSLPMDNPERGMQFRYYDQSQSSPMSFYYAKQGKPDDVAAGIARLFLGVRLECAQCHNHPFGKWTREEFWSQASFFAGLKGQAQGDFFYGPLTEVSDRRELNIPNTDRVAQAKFLDGTTPKWKFKVSARTTLADWMVTKDNPFFAKAMVNRMWAHFFGIGLVDPVDDIVDDNPASHPELLNYLAKEFAEHDFDIKFLIRAITMSKTYQRSSTVDTTKPVDIRLFARMPVKGLTSDQLYDSLVEAAGIRDRQNFQQRLFSFGSQRQTFTEKFTAQDKMTEHHTSITQALTMMNNQLIATATNPDQGQTLGAIVSSTFMKAPAKVEALFLAALSRKPTPDELAKFTRYVEKGGVNSSEKKALGDVFWALLNSTEFKFNH